MLRTLSPSPWLVARSPLHFSFIWIINAALPRPRPPPLSERETILLKGLLALLCASALGDKQHAIALARVFSWYLEMKPRQQSGGNGTVMTAVSVVFKEQQRESELFCFFVFIFRQKSNLFSGIYLFIFLSPADFIYSVWLRCELKHKCNSEVWILPSFCDLHTLSCCMLLPVDGAECDADGWAGLRSWKSERSEWPSEPKRWACVNLWLITTPVEFFFYDFSFVLFGFFLVLLTVTIRDPLLISSSCDVAH